MMEMKKFPWLAASHRKMVLPLLIQRHRQATLLRDVVKNTVAMFYAAQEPVEEEETAVTVAE